MKPFLTAHRRGFVATGHALLAAIALLASFLLRFDLRVPESESDLLVKSLCIAIPVKLSAYVIARLHRGWWRQMDVRALPRILAANLAASVAFSILCLVIIGPRMPRSVYLLDFVFSFLLTALARFGVRGYNEALAVELSSSTSRRLLIYGAGAAGRALAREIRTNVESMDVAGFLDDDPRKRGMEIAGVRVLGSGRDAATVVDRFRARSRRVDEIIIAMPAARGAEMQEALANCRAARVPCRTLPAVSDLMRERFLTAQVRNVNLDDLLGREQVSLDTQRIGAKLRDAAVLVTGAAGSIGSEICRQIARFEPGLLVAFDQAESALYGLDLELRQTFPGLPVVTELGDICDSARMDEVLRLHAVQVVFHAAAYKHVPLMEAHPIEAVRNNVLGTWDLLSAVRRNRVHTFVMISSDKAVNPVSVMGATKRVSELMVSSLPESPAECGTFLSVRFGNVLGSNGSVVPVFQAQIAKGGPVTVTHPDMKRYFMTIPEAVQLVLQASTMGKGADIFVLDMGRPVCILDLANQLIRLNGNVPGEDIQIQFVGAREGERLDEELMHDGEHLAPTTHPRINVFRGPRVKRRTIEVWVQELCQLSDDRNSEAIIEHLKRIAPEYRPERALAGRASNAQAAYSTSK